MSESDLASVELATIVNDVDAETFFAKGGPLAWFSPKKTYASAHRRGTLTDKQVPLVRSVYQQYSKLKEVSRQFAATGEANRIASILYRLLQQKPKVESREDRGRSQKLSRIIRVFRDGLAIHIGHFNYAESLVADLPTPDKESIWEQIHSARRVYLGKLFEGENRGSAH
jgi:hypothetical protein